LIYKFYALRTLADLYQFWVGFYV